MTVRAKFRISELTDLGAGQPKRVMGQFFHDAAIPEASRIIGSTGWNFLTLNSDNQSLLAQLAVGKVIVVDLSVEDGAPAIAPAPAPVPAQLIAVNEWPDKILQFGNCWAHEDLWGTSGMTRGTYTDNTGTTFENYLGVSQSLGANGEVSARFTGKFPDGESEVKGYPSIITGNKPGWQNDWVTPGGYKIILPDGSESQQYPSGKTPGSIFPLALPLTSLKCSVAYTHNATPTGKGHLAYDIWLQSVPDQKHGFNSAHEISTEIMIPLDYWGGYGAYVPGGGGRSMAEYVMDVTLSGYLWHCFFYPNFNGQWKFVVYEPDVPGIQPGTLDLAAFINHSKAQGWTTGVSGYSLDATHCVSVELGIEPEDGTFDLTISNYRVYQ